MAPSKESLPHQGTNITLVQFKGQLGTREPSMEVDWVDEEIALKATAPKGVTGANPVASANTEMWVREW